MGTITNNGMVANIDEMLHFVNQLKQMMDNLKSSMDQALKSVNAMQNAGYDDITFKTFQAEFEQEVTFINTLNEKLDNSAKHYQKLAALVSEHTGNKFKGSGTIIA